MSFPDPHHPWDPPASGDPPRRLARPRPAAGPSRLPRRDPRAPGQQAAALARLLRRHASPTWRAGRPHFVPGALTDDQIREVNAKAHVMNELIDEACGRVLARHRRAGLGRRHRRRLHHRPRRAAGRLRPALQGTVPRRRADAPAPDLAAGTCRRGDARGRSATRSARSTWPRPSAPSPGVEPADWMQGRALPTADGEPGRERMLCEWDSQFPGYGMHLRSIYRDGWLCTVYEPSTAGRPNGLERTWGDGRARSRARWSTRRPNPGRAGWRSPPASCTRSTRTPISGTTASTTRRCGSLRDELVADLYDHLPTETAPAPGRRAGVAARPRNQCSSQAKLWRVLVGRAPAGVRRLRGGDHPGRGSVGAVARQRSRRSRTGPRRSLVVLAAGRRRRAAPGAADHRRHRRPAGDPRLLVPAGDRRLSRRRRRVRRLAGQPRGPGEPGRRRGPGRRLHDDRGRLDRGRRGRADSAFPGLRSATVPICLGILASSPCSTCEASARRPGVPAPHDAVHRRAAGRHRRGLRPPARARRAPAGQVTGPHPRPAGGDDPARAEGLLRRVQRADRRGGDRQRRAAVQRAPRRAAKRTEMLLGPHPRRDAAGLAVLARRWQIGPGRADGPQPDHGHGHRPRPGLLRRVPTITVVLALAANTSFGGLPVLASLLARDNYLPHLFSLRGDRQVFSNGIWALALMAGACSSRSAGTRTPSSRCSPSASSPASRCRRRVSSCTGGAPGRRVGDAGGDQRPRGAHHGGGHGRVPGGEVHRGCVGRGRGRPAFIVPLRPHPRLLRLVPHGDLRFDVIPPRSRSGSGPW